MEPDSNYTTSSTPRPGPIADDATSIAERLKQIQQEEGRGEKREAPQDSYYGQAAAYGETIYTCLATISGRNYAIQVDKELGAILVPLLENFPGYSLVPGMF